jgi:acyl carrier protein
MARMDILEQVRLIMEDVFDVENLSISPPTRAADIEEWDSLSHIRLVVALEKNFRIRFSGDDLEKLKNVGDLVAMISAKTG